MPQGFFQGVPSIREREWMPLNAVRGPLGLEKKKKKKKTSRWAQQADQTACQARKPQRVKLSKEAQANALRARTL